MATMVPSMVCPLSKRFAFSEASNRAANHLLLSTRAPLHGRSRGPLDPPPLPWLVFVEGLRPSNSPTRSLAGAPRSPLRSRGSFAALTRSPTRSLAGAPRSPSAPVARFLSRGFALELPTRSLAGPRGPRSAPRGSFAALTRSPTRSLAGAPGSPLRSRGSFSVEGLRPSNSPTRSLAGAPGSPLRSVARSLRSLAPLHGRSRGPLDPRSAPVARFLSRGFAPRTPPHARSRGPLAPRSAPVARSLRSLAPLHGRSRGPLDPRSAPVARSLRSLAPVVRSFRSFATLG